LAVNITFYILYKVADIFSLLNSHIKVKILVKIEDIKKGSPAARAKIPRGELISVNGHPINDVLDYMYYSTGRDSILEIAFGGKNNTYRIKKGEYEDLGLEFESFLMDKERRCTNNCVFCFIDQNPKGLRDTLYFKDDDARLSFLTGNYITLTNLSESDIDRIIKMKLSVNISLHTMNLELRVKMMRNRFAGKGIDYLKRMIRNGIKVNIQLVLCPGLNDGAELIYTLDELYKLADSARAADAGGDHPGDSGGEDYPTGDSNDTRGDSSGESGDADDDYPADCGLQSIAVVPVGLSKYRDGLYPLSAFDKTSAGAVIDTVLAYQAKFSARFDRKIVYASDEFFLIADRPIPDCGYYDDYPQYENGVGMLRSLIDEFADALNSINSINSISPPDKSNGNTVKADSTPAGVTPAADGEFLPAGISAGEAAENKPRAKFPARLVRPVKLTRQEAAKARGQIADKLSAKRLPENLVIATGESAYPTVSALVDRARAVFPELRCEVIAVKNEFFGGYVTVTGLLTGGDIIKALAPRKLSGTLLLCEDMFKFETETFLDDTMLSDVKNALGMSVEKISRDGGVLLRRLIDSIRKK
jgi:NifB/MoaA-like Fe-S oxidoreductase